MRGTDGVDETETFASQPCSQACPCELVTRASGASMGLGRSCLTPSLSHRKPQPGESCRRTSPVTSALQGCPLLGPGGRHDGSLVPGD